MADKKSRHVFDDIRGGRNGCDPPWAIADNECVEAINVDFFRGRMGNKRNGMEVPVTTGTTRAGITSSLFRHVPGTDETAAELWAVDDGNGGPIVVERLAGGTVWSAPTLKDAPTGNGWDFTFASINGKLFIAYKSAVDRLHCWDPVSGSVRRTGLAATAAPTVANTGGGAYAAVLRYYRQRSTVQVGGVTIRRSEPSPSVSFTPSGAGTAARVTQATVINEGETHWEVEASTDNVTFNRIATVVIGTTTYDDSAVTTTYSAGVLSALTGTYTLQKSYKFLAADQNRILGFGCYTSTNKQNDIELSAVIGSLNVSDEERIDTTTNYRMGFDEADSGVATGICGPVFGSYFAFKDRQTWQLTPTGTTAQPFRQQALSKTVGALAHFAITIGDDADGNPSLYWMSSRGPYRWSIRGLEYIGRNIEDLLIGPYLSMNLGATKVVARALHYPAKRQTWFWVAVGEVSADSPNLGLIYDETTGGWSRSEILSVWSSVRCATLFSNTLGASMSRDLKPYVGESQVAQRIWKADTGQTDGEFGLDFAGYVLTKAIEPGGPGFYGEVGDPALYAQAPSVILSMWVFTDGNIGGSPTASTTLDFTGVPTLARTVRVAQGIAQGSVLFAQYAVGDVMPIPRDWTLDRLVIPITQNEPVSQ